MPDELKFLDAQDAFILGNFQLALKNLKQVKTSDLDMKLKIDVLTYQVYIAQKKYGIVLEEIPEDTEILEMKLLRLLAQLFSKKCNSTSIHSILEQILPKQLSEEESNVITLAATLYLNLGMPEAALKILHSGTDPRNNALTIQCLLSIHRFDLAGKVVRRMQTADEDSLPVQLCSALYYLRKGGEQLQEAQHIYQELREKYGPSVLLLNGQAAALIGLSQWDEAESLLQEALDLDGNNPETLVNLIMVYHHLGKPIETINRLTYQLKDCYSDHPFLIEYAAKDEEFTRCAQQYGPRVKV